MGILQLISACAYVVYSCVCYIHASLYMCLYMGLCTYVHGSVYMCTWVCVHVSVYIYMCPV